MITETKILIVDDSETNVLLIESYINSLENCTSLVARNGKDALKIIEKEQPKIIILDIMMPGMDGFEVLKKIRANKQSNGSVVIMVSAKDRPNDIREAMSLGANDYVKKPIGANKLFEKLRKYL